MRREKGQVLVELAFALPLLLAFTFAVIDYGRAMYARNSLINAARCGARAAAVLPSLTAEADTPLASASSPMATVIKSQMGSADYSQINYQLNIINAGNTVTGQAQTGNQVQVVLTWNNFPMITPLNAFLALLVNGTPQQSNGMTLSGQASMSYE